MNKALLATVLALVAPRPGALTLENHRVEATSLSRVHTVVCYWNLHSEPEGLEGALKIIQDLNPDMI